MDNYSNYREYDNPRKLDECPECEGTGDLGERMVLDNDGNIVSMVLLCSRCHASGVYIADEPETWREAI